MIHSKKHKNGFTLIEVVMAMTITALVMSPIFIIYGTILQFVNRSSQEFDYMLLCKNVLYEARQKQDPEAQEFSFDKAETDFEATLIYSLGKGVDPKSSLTSLQGLHRELVTVSWVEQGVKKQDTLVTFIYKKPEQTLLRQGFEGPKGKS
jgi:prepilin-type N-terminal cleavage/methylation domain-containing protein